VTPEWPLPTCIMGYKETYGSTREKKNSYACFNDGRSILVNKTMIVREGESSSCRVNWPSVPLNTLNYFRAVSLQDDSFLSSTSAMSSPALFIRLPLFDDFKNQDMALDRGYAYVPR
jgi:hypothetical protein